MIYQFIKLLNVFKLRMYKLRCRQPRVVPRCERARRFEIPADASARPGRQLAQPRPRSFHWARRADGGAPRRARHSAARRRRPARWRRAVPHPMCPPEELVGVVDVGLRENCAAPLLLKAHSQRTRPCGSSSERVPRMHHASFQHDWRLLEPASFLSMPLACVSRTSRSAGRGMPPGG